MPPTFSIEVQAHKTGCSWMCALNPLFAYKDIHYNSYAVGKALRLKQMHNNLQVKYMYWQQMASFNRCPFVEPHDLL